MKNYSTVDNRADYAEMFEALPEFSSEKIPCGTSVVLVGDKIRPANNNEVPFGVISSFPIMLGNNPLSNEWTGKYIKDEFGLCPVSEKDVWVKNEFDGKKQVKKYGLIDGKIPEGAIVRKMKLRDINPDFDETMVYIPRLKRNEWNMVGLVGRVKILKGQPVAPNWIKMKEISENVDEWLVR